MSWRMKVGEANSCARERSLGTETKCDESEREFVVHEESRYGTVRTARSRDGSKISTSTQSA